jgi:hypothetical protein
MNQNKVTQSKVCEEEVKTAWLLLKFNWVLLAALGVAFALGIGLAGFSINFGDLVFSLGFVAIYAHSPMPMRARPDDAIRR